MNGTVYIRQTIKKPEYSLEMSVPTLFLPYVKNLKHN